MTSVDIEEKNKINRNLAAIIRFTWYLLVCLCYLAILCKTPIVHANKESQEVSAEPTVPLHGWPFDGKHTNEPPHKVNPKDKKKTENKNNKESYNTTHGTRFLAYDCNDAVHEAVVTVKSLYEMHGTRQTYTHRYLDFQSQSK